MLVSPFIFSLFISKNSIYIAKDQYTSLKKEKTKYFPTAPRRKSRKRLKNDRKQ
jgi:hypothetical protein